MYPRILSKFFTWVESHGCCGVEFQEPREHIWALFRCSDDSQFCRVCVANLSCLAAVWGKRRLCRDDSLTQLVPTFAWSWYPAVPMLLLRRLSHYWEVGISRNLWNTPFFELHPFERCLQRTASSMFGTLDAYSMTEFIAKRLKNAGEHDWIVSRQALKKTL